MLKIPNTYNNLREDFPEASKEYHYFGKVVPIVSPQDDKTRALVKSAMFLDAQKECDVHSYIRKALDAGCTKEEFN